MSLCCGHSVTDQWFQLTAFHNYCGVGKHWRGWTGLSIKQGKGARLRWSHNVSSYAASGTTTLSHAVLFSPLSFRNLKYAITEDCRNVPSVREACSLGFSRPCVTIGQGEAVNWICLIWCLSLNMQLTWVNSTDKGWLVFKLCYYFVVPTCMHFYFLQSTKFIYFPYSKSGVWCRFGPPDFCYMSNEIQLKQVSEHMVTELSFVYI